MTKKDPTQTTTNAGPPPDKKRTDADDFDSTGNVKVKGQDPSPDDRQRGEVSDKESTAS